MTRLNTFLVFFLFSLIAGCDDEKTQTSTDTINITLKNTDTYNYDFGLMGIEGGATFKIEAQHAASSSLIRNNENRLIYSYRPEENFIGTDKVQIQRCLSPGNASCYALILTTINFTVTH